MTRNQIITAFSQLGKFILDKPETLTEQIHTASIHNPWFNKVMVQDGLESMAKQYFNEDKLTNWLAAYPYASQPKTIALIMAGNIAAVGFHDLLTVLCSGNTALIKLSSKDQFLPKFLIDKLIAEQPKLAERIQIANGPLKGFDAIIATGSDSSAMYFESYFSKYPHIIRKNRNAVAVLKGNETDEELLALGKDVFTHYGLGCRNVSKIFTPEGYDLQHLLDVLHHYDYTMDNNKYKNNFDYNLTLLLMNNITHLKNDSLLLVEDESLTSRIATLHYHYYKSLNDVEKWITDNTDKVQCVVGSANGNIPFGEAQNPALTDYADGVNTLEFLKEL